MAAGQQALSGGGGPTVANAARIPAVDPRLQALHGRMRAGGDPMDYINAAYPSQKLQAVKADENIVDMNAGGKIVASGQAKPAAKPSSVQEFEYGLQNPAYNAWNLQGKKAAASSVNVNTAKPLLNEIAGGLGKQIDATLAGAKAAQGAISTAHNLMRAIDTGKIVAGPGASFRVLGLQIGQSLRSAIQSMAQSELDAAQQMKGQGQITEAERDIIRRAASGNIDDMTSPEIRLLATTMEKMARTKIKSHKGNLESLRKMPEAAPLLPFYSVDEPPAYGAGDKGLRKYNPATGRIE